ncbi:50S ribosomal protein L7/L12 [uncultured bacterium]|nr:50S ribosomal protein L7/L12 [uncultured bacterium]
MLNKNLEKLVSDISNLSLNELIDLSNKLAVKYGCNNLKEFMELFNPKESVKEDNQNDSKNQNLFEVVLVEIDTMKRASAIRKIKEFFGCTISEAKDKIDSCLPLSIKKDVLLEEAEFLINEWAEFGVKLEKK